MRKEMGHNKEMKILNWEIDVQWDRQFEIDRGMWNYLRIGCAELPEYPRSQAVVFYKCCMLEFGDVVEKGRAAVKVRQE